MAFCGGSLAAQDGITDANYAVIVSERIEKRSEKGAFTLSSDDLEKAKGRKRKLIFDHKNVCHCSSVSRRSGYLEFGTRSEFFFLLVSEKDYIDEEDRRQTFLGSINRLEERQSLLPVQPFLAVTPLPWFGFELAWSALRVRTRSFTVDPTDGDFVLMGPLLQLFFRYPNTTRITPYGGVGMVFYQVDFDHADWWRRGYPSYERWVSLGRPKEYHRNYQRRFTPKNTHGPTVSVGCLVDIVSNWAIDIHARYAKIYIDNHYTMLIMDSVIDDRGLTTFPFSHYTVGVGARYSF